MLATRRLLRLHRVTQRIKEFSNMTGNSLYTGLSTRVVPVKECKGGFFDMSSGLRSFDTWVVPTELTPGLTALRDAAKLLKMNRIVAFPTETVYGLGANATHSEAVRGIYTVKGRPSDNPLIVHVADLNMLRSLLPSPGKASDDPIPLIYKPIIACFWPGPLTIILDNPPDSKLAAEVTATGTTFATRMPESALARTLIKLAGVPIAAPSANASGKPSPTTAQHVLYDLDGKIELILDGGACDVGVESTVINGLCDPPMVLRPGGISIEQIRQCAGWQNVQIGYKDEQEAGDSKPLAPGMKYKHYSPKAMVILVEGEANAATEGLTQLYRETGAVWRDPEPLISSQLDGIPNGTANSHSEDITSHLLCTIGIVRTVRWDAWGGWNDTNWAYISTDSLASPPTTSPTNDENTLVRALPAAHSSVPCSSSTEKHTEKGYVNTDDASTGMACTTGYLHIKADLENPSVCLARVISISLGTDTKEVAHGLFAALRELDAQGADVIYVEGVSEEGGITAAVMNRLRKAATVVKK